MLTKQPAPEGLQSSFCSQLAPQRVQCNVLSWHSESHGVCTPLPWLACFCCLHRHNEAYTWTNPTCCVHNVILGQLWIEQYGTVEILNHRWQAWLCIAGEAKWHLRFSGGLTLPEGNCCSLHPLSLPSCHSAGVAPAVASHVVAGWVWFWLVLRSSEVPHIVWVFVTIV
jgi:hypothetical protein